VEKHPRLVDLLY